MRFLIAFIIMVGAIPALASIINRPYLQAVTQNSIYVLVECTTSDTVLVEYGFTGSYGFTARTELISLTTSAPATFVHKVMLPGLIPDTVYHYRATHLGSVSLDATFRTSKPVARGFRFAWMADSRTNSSVYDAIAGLVLAKQPEFTIIGGDVCASSSYSAWQSEFFRPNGLALISHVPFFFATGNHEGWSTNSMAFTRAPASPSNSQDYFSFDYGDVHVLVLDTEVSYAPGSPQYVFAQDDLTGTTRQWKIVACHKPAYCSGGHGEDAGMKTMTTNIFEPAGVDLVIAGHSHFYQHNVVHGLHHLVIGTAGAPWYVPTNASYTIKSVEDYNYAVFDVAPGTLRMTVYNSSDVVLDTLALSRQMNAGGDEEEETGFQLNQNYPNPFNPVTTIQYSLASGCHVTLKVYDVLGNEVVTLVDGMEAAGNKSVRFEAGTLSSGIYFCVLQAGTFREARKLALVR